MSAAAKIAVGYFAVVAAVVVVVAVITAADDDAALAGVWAIAATLPGSLLPTWLGVDGGGVQGVLLLLAVAGVQALALYGLVRLVSSRARS